MAKRPYKPKVIEPSPIQEPKIRTETIISSKSFRKKYQIDFMRALLTEPEYSIKEATKILDDYFKRKVGN